MEYMAAGTDVTDPDHPISAHGSGIVNDVVTLLHYDDRLLQCDPDAMNLLRPVDGLESSHTAQALVAHERLMKDLRLCMAKGKYALIRGWHPDLPATWNAQSVLAFKGSVTQQVQYHGMCSDNYFERVFIFN